MEIRQTEWVTSEQEVTVAYKCDNCGKQVGTNHLPKDWHSFTSYHDEWGNDSVDSLESYDVCSPQCYKSMLSFVVDNRLNGYRTAKIDGMNIVFAKLLIESFKIST